MGASTTSIEVAVLPWELSSLSMEASVYFHGDFHEFPLKKQARDETGVVQGSLRLAYHETTS